MRILVIEDSPSDRFLLERVFAKISVPEERFELTFATTLAEGLRLLHETSWQAVILDLNLPDSTHLETVTAVMDRTQAPVVILAHVSDLETGQKAMHMGVQDYIVKDHLNSDFMVESGLLRRIMLHAMDRQSLRLRLLSEVHERQRNERRYYRLFEHSNDAILICDLSLKILDTNERAEQLFGYAKCEFNGFFLSDLLAPSQRPLDTKSLLDKGSSLEEILCRASTGRIFPAESSFSLFDAVDGACLQIAMRDVTDRKRLEELKDQFASTISHEMRTPLLVVCGVLENLLDGLEGDLSQGQAELLRLADNNLKLLQKIINDLLEFSKLESGLALSNERNLDLPALITEVCRGFQKGVGDKNVEVSFKSEGEFAEVLADPDLTFRVLNNLIGNAVRFAKSRVEVGVSRYEDGGKKCLRVSVADNGPGIPESEWENIFNKYVQLALRKDALGYEGMGLGLSLCKELVEGQGGMIWLESNQGLGSTFYFTLPCYNESKHFLDMLRKQVGIFSAKSSSAALVRVAFDREIGEDSLDEIAQTMSERVLRRFDRIFISFSERSVYVLSVTDGHGAVSLAGKIARYLKETLPSSVSAEVKIHYSLFPDEAHEPDDLIAKVRERPLDRGRSFVP